MHVQFTVYCRVTSLAREVAASFTRCAELAIATLARGRLQPLLMNGRIGWLLARARRPLLLHTVCGSDGFVQYDYCGPYPATPC